jgi:preprotein translocase subunit SecE
MATEVVRRTSWIDNLRAVIAGIGPFIGEVRSEMRKVSWPDRQQLWEATRTIIIFVLLIALVIFLMDQVLQLVLVRGIPSLFR